MAQPRTSSSPAAVAVPLRVLTRPSPSLAAAASASASKTTPPSATAACSSSSSSVPASSSSSVDGVVVVGFLGSTPSTDATHLINRVLDANIFGSGNVDKDLLAKTLPDLRRRGKEWFQRRRISFYHEAEKGMVFLNFSSSVSPLSLLSSSRTGGGLELEEVEADDLRGMLFMFSVCHVIIFIHESLRFDTQILKRFRMLQNAKHALAPFIKSKIAPASSKTTSFLSLPTSRTFSISSPSRRGGATSRHGSSISLMSGSASQSLVLPGHCTPVILFLFCDDFVDMSNPSSNPEDSNDALSLNQQNGVGGLPKPSLNVRGSGPVVMLARLGNKTEGGFRKKLHSSLEQQVRFLIKKCRTLVGVEPSNIGTRGANSTTSLPLFLLDASRVALLADRSMIQRCESLDYVTSLIEESWNSKASMDILSLENNCQNLNYEEIQAIKDFIQKQADTLRGRGGLLSNANSGSVTGVGMVAAAAAAAAASTAAGKSITAPELPSLECWLSLSTLILESLLPAKDGFLDEIGNTKESHSEKHDIETQDEQNSSEGSGIVEAAISSLESCKGLNMRFSISWCEKALPAAREIYLNELPALYPTTLHKTHLEKALHAFSLMVRGPAMQEFLKKLEDECTAIWESGRQLCDAVSLTGKPCMHPRHDLKTSDSHLKGNIKQHSSGYVFLHACACGRSRRLREDPFDFESANIMFSCFPNCEDFLPNLILPKSSNAGPFPVNSWRLVRIAGASYYNPSKGLLQIGFRSNEKHLAKLSIYSGKQKDANNSSTVVPNQSSVTSTKPQSKVVTPISEAKKPSADHFQREHQSRGSNDMESKAETVLVNGSSISFGKGLPSFPMKKPFSEIVAGKTNIDSEFPALQQSKQPKTTTGKGGKQIHPTEKGPHQDTTNVVNEPQVNEHTSTQSSTLSFGISGKNEGNPFLKIGSNIVPVKIVDEKVRTETSMKQVNVYFGFEHECSYGHRFLLSQEHLKDLAISSSSSDGFDGTKGVSNNYYDKVPENSHEATSTVTSTKKNPPKSVECELKLVSHFELDVNGSAFSLLNRKLPIYMDCPHCRKMNKDNQKIKFASTTSQLQRIFLVTPQFPVVLATCPVVQFEESCLPPSIQNREQQSRFSLGCRVILPPSSFVTLRLPFVYGVQMNDGSLHPLNHFEHQPERTAWLVEGTALHIVSMGPEYDKESSFK